jgi:mono/diheme cytochrome c family protein
MPRIAFLLASLFLTVPFGRADDAAALWSNGVQPLLDQHCVKCHGPLEQKSELELDTVEAVLKGSENGAVVVPGKPDESLLIEVFAPKSDPHMPPKKQLSDHEIAKVRTWIAALGEPMTEVAQVARPEIPPASMDPVVAIDHFLGAEWKAHGITPAGVCDDRTFVRRIYLDLAGRIPTRDEASGFLMTCRQTSARSSWTDCWQATNMHARFGRCGMHF